jgi:hypothetical protein
MQILAAGTLVCTATRRKQSEHHSRAAAAE